MIKNYFDKIVEENFEQWSDKKFEECRKMVCMI
jgi:hypothetical protein